MAADGEAIVARLSADPLLALFLSPELNVESFVGDVLAGGELPPDVAAALQSAPSLEETPAEAAVERIRARADVVDAALRAVVSDHQEAFLSTAGATAGAKAAVSALSGRLTGLVAAVA